MGLGGALQVTRSWVIFLEFDFFKLPIVSRILPDPLRVCYKWQLSELIL